MSMVEALPCSLLPLYLLSPRLLTYVTAPSEDPAAAPAPVPTPAVAAPVLVPVHSFVSCIVALFHPSCARTVRVDRSLAACFSHSMDGYHGELRYNIQCPCSVAPGTRRSTVSVSSYMLLASLRVVWRCMQHETIKKYRKDRAEDERG